MSGVIIDGQQWEHCGECSAFVRFPQDLGYQRPTGAFHYGRHLCVHCADEQIRSGKMQFEEVIPAPSWQVVEYK